MKDVVVSGIGVVSPIGIGRDAFWDSIQQRRSGVTELSVHDSPLRRVRFGGEVRQFDAKPFIRPRKSLKVMCREIQMAVVAANLSLDDAQLESGMVDPERLGVNFGCEMFYGHPDDLQDVYRNCLNDGEFLPQRWGTQAMSDIHPLWMLKYLPNMPACHIAIAHDVRGPNNSIALAEASSLLAIAQAAQLIQRGGADVVIAGGTGNRLNLTESVYRGDRLHSHRSDDPAAAARPFDALRDGMVCGEGAGAVVLEESGHAQARGARPLARVLGFHSTFAPRPGGHVDHAEGMRRAIRGSLSAAGVGPDEVAHVNAHGWSVDELDVAEAEAIRTCLSEVPVTAPKSFFGNLGAGSGAVELIASILSLQSAEVPVTLNYEQPDPRCPVRVVHGQPCRTEKSVALALNETLSGQAVAAVLAAV